MATRNVITPEVGNARLPGQRPIRDDIITRGVGQLGEIAKTTHDKVVLKNTENKIDELTTEQEEQLTPDVVGATDPTTDQDEQELSATTSALARADRLLSQQPKQRT